MEEFGLSLRRSDEVLNQFPVESRSCCGCARRYPDRFRSIQDVRRFCQDFFPWYTHHHHHSGLQLLTLATVHHGQAAQLISGRLFSMALSSRIPNSSSAGHPDIHPGPKPSGSIPQLPTRKILSKLLTNVPHSC